MDTPTVLSSWDRLVRMIKSGKAELPIDGLSLDLATVVAVARYGASTTLSPGISKRVEASSKFLLDCIAKGGCIYGVNTGFGGSADTRTSDTHGLQQGLVEMLQYGVLHLPDDVSTPRKKSVGETSLFSKALPNNDLFTSTCMPEAWVRGSMLVRMNSLASGNSGVRLSLIHSVAALLHKNIIPLVPLRGSISASGDLSPLSYLAGTLQGSPNIRVWTTDPVTKTRTIIPASTALLNAGIPPIHLGPKEGLAMVNGTAVSASVATLALHDAHTLTLLAQILTALGVEALAGSAESFHPFIASVRPHPGQTSAVANIRSFLSNSHLTSCSTHNIDEGGLRQDRYSIRTAAQWLGPVLEDLQLAHRQLAVELNSTTDNPLIDLSGPGEILQGGNFQALAVTLAMEKTRAACGVVGRMLFAQCTELINPATNNGLPPNLAGGEPSRDFLMKGVDIALASLQSELGFLASPVVSHVQTAEMGNQALNSLALISARYTLAAVDVLQQMVAYYLFAVCQALDLRAMMRAFSSALRPRWEALTVEVLAGFPAVGELNQALWRAFCKEMDRDFKLDSRDRIQHAVAACRGVLVGHVEKHPLPPVGVDVLDRLRSWGTAALALTLDAYTSARQAYVAAPDAAPLLGSAGKRVYAFVRGQLGVPFLSGERVGGEAGTIGDLVGRIVGAVRDGRGGAVGVECLREAVEGGKGVKAKL